MEATGIQHIAGKSQPNKWTSVPISDTCKDGICSSCVDNHELIKFTGHERFNDSLKVIQTFLPKDNMPATIISPFALSKNNRLKEQDLVQLTKQYFEPLGFIKLHLYSIADFHEYGKNENV